MEKQEYTSFADLAITRRKIKDQFFNQINTLINWKRIDTIIGKSYSKGESVAGRPSYPGLLLFKICLLQTWYGLSDYEVEDQVNDRISFSRFVGLSMDDKCPDHSVISRFRTAMTEKKAYDKLFKEMNKQLQSHKIIVNTGVIVDASITDSPRKPKGFKEYEVVEDRKEHSKEEDDDSIDMPDSKDNNQEVCAQQEPQTSVDKTKAVKLTVKTKPGVDTDGKWVKKAGKLRFGFKQHTGTDENGMITGVITTPANESDMNHLEDVVELSDLPKDGWVMADKGYKSKKNDLIVESHQWQNRIMNRAFRNRPLTEEERIQNKEISKIRYKVERAFGSMRRWFGAGTARYIGLDKMHTQHLMEAMAYNLYRSPRIAMSICVD